MPDFDNLIFHAAPETNPVPGKRVFTFGKVTGNARTGLSDGAAWGDIEKVSRYSVLPDDDLRSVADICGYR